MLELWCDWLYKRSIIKPILTMSGTYGITVNGFIVDAALSDEVKEVLETILMQQALGYIEYAEQFGAKLLPVKVKIRRHIQNEIIQFYLKFENKKQRNKFEELIKQL